MTGAQFLRAAKALGGMRTLFKFPYTYLIFVSDEFESLDEEEREIIFSQKLGLDIEEIRSVQANNLMSLQLVTSRENKQEFESASPRSHHWIESFIESAIAEN